MSSWTCDQAIKKVHCGCSDTLKMSFSMINHREARHRLHLAGAWPQLAPAASHTLAAAAGRPVPQGEPAPPARQSAGWDPCRAVSVVRQESKCLVGIAAQLEWDRVYGQGCAGGEQLARTRQINPSAHAVGLVHGAGQSAEGAAAVKQAGLLPSRWAHKEKMCKQHMQPGHMLTRPACVPGRGRAFHSCSCSLLISRGTVGSFSCGRSPADSNKVMGGMAG